MSNDQGEDDTSKPSGRWRLPDQLPPLSGWGRKLFLAVWSVLFFFAAGVFVVSLPRAFVVPPVNPAVSVGLGLDYDIPGLITRTVGDETARLGIRRGDRLIRIDGQPAGSDVPQVNRQLAGPAGERVAVGIQRPDGSVAQHLLTRNPENEPQAFSQAGLTRDFYFAVAHIVRWLSSFMLLLFAAILVFRRLRDPLVPWASVMMIVLALGTGGLSLWLGEAGGIWTSIRLWASTLSPTLVMVLALLPNGSFRPRWTWAVLAGALLLIPLLLVFSVPRALSSALFGILLVAAVLLPVLRYRTMGISERQQIRWVLFGLALAVIAFGLGSAGLWIDVQSDSQSVSILMRLWGASATAASLILFVAAITVALLRYRLYDADVTISRSVALGALTLLLLGIFAGTEKLIEALGEQYFGESLGALAGGIGAALAAVMIVPLHHRVNHWAEKRFQRQLVELRHDLPLLVNDLRATAGMDRIAAVVLDAVRRGVRARHAALLVGDALVEARGIEGGVVETWRAGWTPATGGGLDRDRADPLFPMRIPLEAEGHGRVGWLLLGPRPDGSFYGKDEREALAAIADPVARAVEVVRVREAKVERDEKRLTAIEQSLSDALSRLASLARPSTTTS